MLLVLLARAGEVGDQFAEEAHDECVVVVSQVEKLLKVGLRAVNVDAGGVRYLFNDLLMPLLRINRSTTSAARSVRDGPRCVTNANGRTFETWRNLGEAVRRCRCPDSVKSSHDGLQQEATAITFASIRPHSTTGMSNFNKCSDLDEAFTIFTQDVKLL